MDDGTADGSDGAESTRLQNYDTGADQTPGVTQPAPTSRAGEGNAWAMNGQTTDGYASSSGSWSRGNGTWLGGGGNLQTVGPEGRNGPPLNELLGSGSPFSEDSPFRPGLQIQNLPFFFDPSNPPALSQMLQEVRSSADQGTPTRRSCRLEINRKTH